MDLFQVLRRADYDAKEIIEYCQTSPEALSLANDSDESIPFHVACRNTLVLKDMSFFTVLLGMFPVGVYAKNKFDWLPIHKALSVANDEHIPAIRYLLKLYPASLTSQSLDGLTPLHCAVTGPRNPSPAVIQLLIEHCPQSLSISDKYGQLPIHKAAAKSRIHEDVVALLIRGNRQSVAVVDDRGFLPLHWLLCRGKFNVDIFFELIEEYGEGLLQADNEELTPYMRCECLPFFYFTVVVMVCFSDIHLTKTVTPS